MRKMTEAELNRFYTLGKCPNDLCESDSFFKGAEGCGFRNVECIACSTKINVADFDSIKRGRFIRAGEILEESAHYAKPCMTVVETWWQKLVRRWKTPLKVHQ